MDTPDLLREIVRTAVQEILEAEMTEHVGASRHERTDVRTGQRNGYKPHLLKTRVGTFLEQAVLPLSAHRESTRARPHGDVCGRLLDPQDREGHRRADARASLCEQGARLRSAAQRLRR